MMVEMRLCGHMRSAAWAVMNGWRGLDGRSPWTNPHNVHTTRIKNDWLALPAT